MYKFKLGWEVKDLITGFRGRITGRADYINGCIQYCVKPRVDDDGNMRDAKWIDEEQLEAIVKNTPITPQTVHGGPRTDQAPVL